MAAAGWQLTGQTKRSQMESIMQDMEGSSHLRAHHEASVEAATPAKAQHQEAQFLPSERPLREPNMASPHHVESLTRRMEKKRGMEVFSARSTVPGTPQPG